MIYRGLLSVTGVVEAVTGVLLLAVPAIVVQLLLGDASLNRGGAVACRIAGAALIALGIACWRAEAGGARRADRGVVGAILFYNIAVICILIAAWIASGIAGIGFWPVILTHAVLGGWCVIALLKAVQGLT
ncbi:hypothetical protein [Pararhizobium sp. DWP1-1-3]|uniref:hypothetical protein n=1 Tax=Pararhizobium sp. DWP1-1-3 TaxID=2804652 RepID=UPI003CF1DD16